MLKRRKAKSVYVPSNQYPITVNVAHLAHQKPTTERGLRRRLRKKECKDQGKKYSASDYSEYSGNTRRCYR